MSNNFWDDKNHFEIGVYTTDPHTCRRVANCAEKHTAIVMAEAVAQSEFKKKSKIANADTVILWEYRKGSLVREVQRWEK